MSGAGIFWCIYYRGWARPARDMGRVRCGNAGRIQEAHRAVRKNKYPTRHTIHSSTGAPHPRDTKAPGCCAGPPCSAGPRSALLAAARPHRRRGGFCMPAPIIAAACLHQRHPWCCRILPRTSAPTERLLRPPPRPRPQAPRSWTRTAGPSKTRRQRQLQKQLLLPSRLLPSFPALPRCVMRHPPSVRCNPTHARFPLQIQNHSASSACLPVPA